MLIDSPQPAGCAAAIAAQIAVDEKSVAPFGSNVIGLYALDSAVVSQVQPVV